MNSVRLWFALVGKSFKTQSVYRMNIIVSFLGGLLLMFVQASVWQALYSQGVQVSSTLAETITYVILSSVLFPSIAILPGGSIGQSVYSGDLGVDMVRPVNLLAQHTANCAGKQLFTLVSYAAPTMMVSVWIFGMIPPAGAAAFLMFLLTLAGGAVIYMLMDTIGGYTAFWLYNNWYVSWLERALFSLFGARIIPMWFYPAWLSGVSGFLPFQYISFIPINIYLGKIGVSEYLGVAAVQLFWILALLAVERAVWFRAQKKLVVQGG